ncbi:Dabb family protein, partial [Streptomyces sp. 900105245]
MGTYVPRLPSFVSSTPARTSARVPGFERWERSDRPIAYDFAINSAVEDPDALKRYLEHPAHQ